jgi:hypothetical protein
MLVVLMSSVPMKKCSTPWCKAQTVPRPKTGLCDEPAYRNEVDAIAVHARNLRRVTG